MNDLGNVFKGMVVIILLFFVFGFVFRVLFKLGLLALLVLGIMYFFKKVFKSDKRRY